MTEMASTEKLGVYIDICNISSNLYEYEYEGLTLDYQRMIEELVGHRDVAVMKGYDCIVDEGSDEYLVQDELRSAGVELVLTESTRKTYPDSCRQYTVQKEVDTGITTDVSWDLATGAVDTALIISGDRDMRPAILRAAAAGKKVEVACLRCSIGDDYASSLTDLTLIDDLEVFLLESLPTSDAVGEGAGCIQTKEVSIHA